jgi:hypothetical protein
MPQRGHIESPSAQGGIGAFPPRLMASPMGGSPGGSRGGVALPTWFRCNSGRISIAAVAHEAVLPWCRQQAAERFPERTAT